MDILKKIGLKMGDKITAVNPRTLEYEECKVIGSWSEGMRDSPTYQAGPRCVFPSDDPNLPPVHVTLSTIDR